MAWPEDRECHYQAEKPVDGKTAEAEQAWRRGVSEYPSDVG